MYIYIYILHKMDSFFLAQQVTNLVDQSMLIPFGHLVQLSLSCFPGDPERTGWGFAEVPLQSARGGESLSRPGGGNGSFLGPWDDWSPKKDGMGWKMLEGPTGLSCTVCFLVFSIVDHFDHSCLSFMLETFGNRVFGIVWLYIPRVTSSKSSWLLMCNAP